LSPPGPGTGLYKPERLADVTTAKACHQFIQALALSSNHLNMDRRKTAGMVQRPEEHERLDRAFAALADPVRRAIIARLSTGPATVNELAEPFPITVQAVSQHVQVLEQAGLVTRTRQAQRRPVHLDPAALEAVTAWIDTYRLQAERSYRRLDAVLEQLKEEQ
jgi:DNA-binding transcriptional ArsR family regulator